MAAFRTEIVSYEVKSSTPFTGERMMPSKVCDTMAEVHEFIDFVIEEHGLMVDIQIVTTEQVRLA